MNPKPRQLSPQEWQLLSAYLDNQVSPAERNQIEKQLASDAAYRQAAESLRQTRTRDSRHAAAAGSACLHADS